MISLKPSQNQTELWENSRRNHGDMANEIESAMMDRKEGNLMKFMI